MHIAHRRKRHQFCAEHQPLPTIGKSNARVGSFESHHDHCIPVRLIMLLICTAMWLLLVPKHCVHLG